MNVLESERTITMGNDSLAVFADINCDATTRAMIMIVEHSCILYFLIVAVDCMCAHYTRYTDCVVGNWVKCKLEKLTTENFAEYFHTKKTENLKLKQNKKTLQFTQHKLEAKILLLILDRLLCTESNVKMNLRCDLADARNATNSVVVVSVGSSRSTLWILVFFSFLFLFLFFFFFLFAVAAVIVCMLSYWRLCGCVLYAKFMCTKEMAKRSPDMDE